MSVQIGGVRLGGLPDQNVSMDESQMRFIELFQELGEVFTTPPTPPQPLILGPNASTSGVVPMAEEAGADDKRVKVPAWAVQCLAPKLRMQLKEISSNREASFLDKTALATAAIPEMASLALPPRLSADAASVMGLKMNASNVAIGMLMTPVIAVTRVARACGIDIRSAEVRRHEAELAQVYGADQAAAMSNPTLNPSTGVAARLDCLELKVIREFRSTSDLTEVDKDPHEEDLPMCAICQVDFEEGEHGFSLKGCGHAFHVKCLNLWLHRSDTCPNCRSRLQESPGCSAFGAQEDAELTEATSAFASSPSSRFSTDFYGTSHYPSGQHARDPGPEQSASRAASTEADQEIPGSAEISATSRNGSLFTIEEERSDECQASDYLVVGMVDEPGSEEEARVSAGEGSRPPSVMSVSRETEPQQIDQMLDLIRDRTSIASMDLVGETASISSASTSSAFGSAAEDTIVAVNWVNKHASINQEAETAKEMTDVEEAERLPQSGAEEQLVLIWNASIDAVTSSARA
mmetsp:Transcript_25114/g.39431  ORF Transcript_25114/g.39431 Transcript_25114/m.39431 type:complete len:521 (-) Transcript_25114:82-1644(-)|eukprot:CAMPEP_0184294840 /NCGR_PEP_ID=MMETSP1049-20130417/5918_1 /TAXON_ID=77928 /ORGANISM="Proteomonas sulcata, Strain CCMP704" /LENGTH=520 /DNA_ID=CAMNT_0026603247 /DNA_START=350 /DNA_END=1912 /DNA_ORIENTATION=+